MPAPTHSARDRHYAQRHSIDPYLMSDGSIALREHSLYDKLQYSASVPSLMRFSTSSISSLPRPSTLSSVGSGTTDHALMRTSVRFVGVSKQSHYCVFMIHVDTGSEQFVINKRYSEFRDLRTELLQAVSQGTSCGFGPCKYMHQIAQVKFPRRKFQWKKDGDLALARDRLRYLQVFIESLLCLYHHSTRRQMRGCMYAHCNVLEKIRAFLQVAHPIQEFSPRDNSLRDSDWIEVRDSTLGDSSSSVSSSASSSTSSTSDSSSPPTSSTTSTPEAPRRSSVRDFPPSTRPSLLRDGSDYQFDQLYTITEDTELLHMHND